MTMNRWLVGGMLLVLLTGMQAFAQRGEKQKDALQGDFAAMATALNLSADQQTQITEKLKAMHDGMANWEQQHPEMKKLRAETRSEDKDTAAKAQDQLNTLMEDRSKLEASLKKAVFDVLTPEQQQTYAGLMVYKEKNYADMVKVLVLTVDQDAKLKDAAKAYAAGKSQWEQENGEKARQLQQQINEAQKTLNALQATQKTLTAPKDKLETDLHAAVMAVLTPDQQVAWKAYKLEQEVVNKFNKAKLTDEQIGKIKALCEQAVKDNPQPGAGSRGGNEIVGKLTQTVTDTILTDAQKEEMKKTGGR